MLVAAVTGAPQEEAAWLEQARAGDMSALARLVTRYQDRVLNTCWRICGNREDAEDLAQEAFLRAIESLSTFRHTASFYTWLFRIAVNLSISHRRKNVRAIKLSLHGADGECLAEHQAMGIVGRAAESQDPAAKLSAREIERRVIQALERIDDDHRAIIVLRDVESLDYQQIGAILEIPAGTVKSRLHRARMELRGLLRAVVEPEEC